MRRSETSRSRRKPFARFRSITCALAAAALGACAPAGRPESGPSPVVSRVLVHNYGWDNVTLYLAQRGTLWRIGDVSGLSDVNLPIPRRVLADLDEVYLVARPIAGRPFRSEPFMFPRGTTAIWTIENPPAMSHVALR